MTAVVLGTSRGTASVAASTTIYRSPAGFSQAYLTEAQAQHKIHCAGVLSNLYVVVSTNNRGTSTGTLRVNGADVTQTLSITASTTGEFEDTTHTDTIASGDLVAIKLTTGSGGTTFNEGIWTLVFAATTNTYNHYNAGNPASVFSTSSTYYNPLNCDLVGATTEAHANYKVKVAGTLKNLGVYVSAASSQAHTVRTRVNGANGAQSVSLTASTTGWFEDLVNTDTVAVDDLVCGQFITGSNVTGLVLASVVVGYETTGAESPLICGNDGTTLATSLTRYWPLSGYVTSRLTEVEVKADSQLAQTLSLMAAYVSANSITATSTIRLRVNGADGTSVLSVGSSATGYFEDASGTDTVAATDELNYKIVTGGSGTSIAVRSMAILSTVSTGGTLYTQSLSGAFTPAATLVKQEIRSLAGAFTPSAVLLKQEQRSLAGAFTPAATLIRVEQRSLAGSVTPTGSLVKQDRHVLAGAFTPAGALVKQPTRSLAGAFTPAGSLTGLKAALKALSGALTPAGSLQAKSLKVLAGTLLPQGDLLKQTRRSLAGTLTSAGSLVGTRLRFVSLSGTLSFVGSLVASVVSFVAPPATHRYTQEIDPGTGHEYRIKTSRAPN